MRAVTYHEYGDPDVLGVEAVDRPEPTDSQVLVEVESASVNPMDTYLRSGDPYTVDSLPATPGSDFAGTVEAVGLGVDDYAVGDWVFGVGSHFHGRGSYAEYLRIPTTHIAPLPSGVSFDEGAAIGHVGVTAWRSLVVYGTPDVGDAVLVHGGSGGVGHIAVQLAAASGCHVVATAGSDDRCEHVEALGANRAVDYHRDDLKEAVLSEVDGGFDVIIDHRPTEYFDFNLGVADEYARLVILHGQQVRSDAYSLARKKEITITNVGSLTHTPDLSSLLAKLGRLLAEGRLSVLIADRFPLAEASEAQRALSVGDAVGKVIIKPQE